jgi:phosphoribosylglycinamide formyltransferase-1
MTNLAVFASGNGSNAERLIDYFRDHENVDVKLILTNNPKAGVLERAANKGVETWVFDRATFRDSDDIVELLALRNIDLIVLAGFLWLVPENLLNAYTNKIINIHPALLPKYGGKGMYGSHVHRAVIDAKEKESGITIHYVNEKYDDGQIIFQKSFELSANETPESLAEKIHKLEYEHFPRVIEKLISEN